MKVVAVLMALFAVGMALMPVWADATPVYPPIIGTLVIAPVWLAGAAFMWRHA